MDRNDVCPLKVSINTKFLNSLQPEWSKYVTLTRQNKDLSDVEYDSLYDTLHVQASKEKRAAKNHDPLALIAHSNAYSSQSHAIDSEEDYQRANQAVIHDDRFDIQTKNADYGGNGNRNARRQNKNQVANAGNGQMLLAMKDEARGTLNEEENDFMLDNAYGDATLEELTTAVIMMTCIQPTNVNAETKPKYDAEAVSEVNASHINLISGMISKGVHEHTNHEKLKTVINTSNDDQIDSNIIFDNSYIKNNGRTVKHASNVHDQIFDIESLAYNVQREAENQQRLNIELKKQKE
ncbi:hypothetical protein Tco_0737292 [Tanacetum coccineum]